MDWFSWLSKTNLDPTLTYEYGLTFARNQLQLEDIPHFNHEFLQSMGISIAKHRLEILKLAKRENGGGLIRPIGLVSAFNKTRKCIRKCFNKLGFRDEKFPALPEPPPRYAEQWRGAGGGALLRKQQSSEKLRQQRPMLKNRPLALSGPLDGVTRASLKLSGPLDGKMIERSIIGRSPKFSGPLDGRVAERIMMTTKSPKFSGPLSLQERLESINKSPRNSGPLDCRISGTLVCSQCNKDGVEFDDDDRSLWAALFQDMKPT